jgi:pimeloyl-ACP methyl ester carboxylesterase
VTVGAAERRGAALFPLGEGPTAVVFVHGSPSDHRMFDDLVALAPRGCRLVRLDLPDHGAGSDEPDASLEALEDALIGAVEATPGEVTIVGHSLGAWLSARVCDRLPARASRFVSVGGFPTLTSEELAMRRAVLGQLERGEVEPAGMRAMLLDLFLGEARTPALDARAWALLDVSRERWLRVLRRMLRVGDVPPVAFSRPVTIVHGARDAAIAHAHAVRLAEASAAARLITLDTASHNLPMTHAAILAPVALAPLAVSRG